MEIGNSFIQGIISNTHGDYNYSFSYQKDPGYIYEYLLWFDDQLADVRFVDGWFDDGQFTKSQFVDRRFMDGQLVDGLGIWRKGRQWRGIYEWAFMGWVHNKTGHW